MAGRSSGRAAACALTALMALTASATARAEWQSSASGVRYFVPNGWTERAEGSGVVASAPSGVSLVVAPLEAAQLASEGAPEALFAPWIAHPRVLARNAPISPLLANGGWSRGTATVERRTVHWHARVVRVDGTHGVLAIALSPRAALTSEDAEHVEVALTSAHMNGGAVRYAGTMVYSSARRGIGRLETPAVLELRGQGELRTLVLPDLDGEACSFRVRTTPSGTMRLDPDQACRLSQISATIVLVGGQVEVNGVSVRLTASGRMSFIARAGQRGPMIAGSSSFNWVLAGTRPQG